MVCAIRSGELERIKIPQIAVGHSGPADRRRNFLWRMGREGLFALARSAYSYRGLARQDFDAVSK